MKQRLTLAALAMVSISAFATPAFDEADADENGSVSAAEAEAAGVDLAAADANTDGNLSADEYAAATAPSAE